MVTTKQISIITPTYCREAYLPMITACVLAQSHPNWQWLVLDDSPTPYQPLVNLSSQDKRIHYWHQTQRMSIGEKRNLLIERSQGQFIAHFDDDDYYGPNYLLNMQQLLESEKADMVKFSGFYMYAPGSDFFGYMDLHAQTGLHYELIGDKISIIQFHDKMKIGQDFIIFYGYSYVYRKGITQHVFFDDINLCDDESFAKRMLASGYKLITVNDAYRDCLHIIHPQSTARCFSAYKIPSFLICTLFPHFDSLKRNLGTDSVNI